MKIGFLKKDRKERFNLKRGWFVNAWRVVDAQGKDMFRPWCDTRKEALKCAIDLGINVQNPRDELT